ncbi:MAG: 16S rRNA (guanine(966)-N(2))-methyltransferase RsmD [Alphaproteobacteria bacterium RIFCSPLOWO2_01_FULL_40_26]|nr:MAG: 16S rRNA (guanine(966)-N(2))-methyltransferase RsmD [Alphaproteobacteria bacterium RIFCSPHIGHO2_02_FULL_40_34]OFW93881.1 MAG: 16S rRNA (guanine(966)-N(2))-methyltransferase RsmD [Alphaproteobacteria bacterium RIFCSPLOWO2_01_FULL_40_26]OFX09154.1 MAG: 16S rRNA (guanine(966)-N(2))-methyltransferase RsmD [Alphaproteobacteria bacterium RIFCSPLOWO2_02_FULL_40_19]OFX11099.1 MAG: 16S rRNA (guanine(966)-N(2))-methyltransferase RsmD [Alphaproteobacteria bacterium RIFCSPLOWO2_12_FULL_40_11]
MRIIAGKFRGRKLAQSSRLKSLRPTTDKNRESLFNILFSRGFKFENAKILDLCCGSGAIAFEALSRGAKSAILVDIDYNHLDLVRKNCEILGVQDQVETICLDVKKLPQNEVFFDLIFIDPPYEQSVLPFIENLLKKNWIQKNSLLVAEFEAKPDSFSDELNLLDLRRYGKSFFAFLELKQPQ